MTAEKKKPEDQNMGTADSKRSLRDDAEGKLAGVPKHSSDLKGHTPEQLIHELQVHQIELEIQAEELKKSKLALEESRDKLLDLYDFAPTGILTISEKELIVEVNLTGSKLLGVERSKLERTRFSKFVVPEEQDQWYWYITNLLRHEGKQCCTLTLKSAGGPAFPARLEGVRLGSGEIHTEARIAFSDITDMKRAEEAMQSTNEYLNNLFDYANAPIIVWDPNYVITRFNHAFENLTHISEQDIIGQPLEVLFPKESKDRSLLQINKTLEGKRWETVEIPILVKDGSVRTVLWNSANIVNPSGRIISTIAQGVDITGRKRAEEALRESEARLMLTLDVGKAGMWEWNPETNEVRFDARFHTLLGYAPGELPTTQKEWLLYHNPEDVPFWTAKAEAYMRGDSPVYESEHRIRNKSGDWSWVFTRGRFADPTPPGSSRWFIGFAINVTDRKQADEALRESAIRFDELAEQSNTVVWEVDTGGLYTYVSHMSQTVWGYPPDELVGRMHFYDMHPEPGREAFKAASFVIFERKEPFLNLENAVQVRDGRDLWVSTNGIPLLNADGTLRGYRGSDTDITERKRAEAALLRVNQKLNVLSHLTRTELSSQIFVLNGYVTMAKIYSAGQDRVIGALEKGEQAIMSINGTIASSKDYQDMGV
ncbi:MAG: PAS domain S-box protein, partial [Methanomicrobiales archaeon]